jgi:hypothetical protein
MDLKSKDALAWFSTRPLNKAQLNLSDYEFLQSMWDTKENNKLYFIELVWAY